MTGEEEEQLQVDFRGKHTGWTHSPLPLPATVWVSLTPPRPGSEMHVETKPISSLSFPYRDVVSEHIGWVFAVQ